MRLPPIGLVCAAALSAAAQEAPGAGPPEAEVAFAPLDFEAAAARARESGRILLVALADGSEESRRLAAETWKDAAVARWIEVEAVAIEPEPAAQPPLAERYGVAALPTVLLLEGDGSELDRLEGFTDPERFVKVFKGVLGQRERLHDLRLRLAQAPRDPLTWIELAQAYSSLRRFDAAVGAYGEAWSAGRDRPGFVLELPGKQMLAELDNMARSHAQARKALLRWRGAALEELIDPTAPGALRAAQEYAAINRAMRDSGPTAKQWERLRTDPRTPAEVLAALFDDKVAAHYYAERRFAELGQGLGDVFARTEELFAELDALRARERAGDPARERRDLPEAQHELYAKTGLYLEVLVRLGREPEAMELADLVLLREPFAEAYLSLSRGARRGGAKDLAAEIDRRALAALAGAELDQFRSQSPRAQDAPAERGR